MSTDPAAGMSERGWPLWEVFVRAKRGLSHVHAGSLHEPLGLVHIDAVWELGEG